MFYQMFGPESDKYTAEYANCLCIEILKTIAFKTGYSDVKILNSQGNEDSIFDEYQRTYFGKFKELHRMIVFYV